MATVFDQLYKTKLQLIAVLAGVGGIGLMMLASWPPAAAWVAALPLPIPLSDLGSALFATGLLAVFFEYVDRRHGEERADQRVRAAVRSEAPAFRDAVLDGFAFSAKALKGVVSDEKLDQLAVSVLAARLKDDKLAHDVYRDVRDQVIGAQERWRDARISVSLNPGAVGPVSGLQSMFVATIRCEYRVRPASATLRFACVADEREYRELLRDQSVAGAWYFDASSNLDPASTDVFEVVNFSVDGKEKTIRRTTRRGAQLYTVSLGPSAGEAKEVTIAYTYRVLVLRHGHVLYVDFPRPTQGIHVHLDYTAAGIRRVTPLDYFSSSHSARVEHSFVDSPVKTVDVGFDGWMFPRSGVAFVWVLKEEASATKK